jgi:hypothetical protein
MPPVRTCPPPRFLLWTEDPCGFESLMLRTTVARWSGGCSCEKPQRSRLPTAPAGVWARSWECRTPRDAVVADRLEAPLRLAPSQSLSPSHPKDGNHRPYETAVV